jgi:hypothetical protein
MLMMNQGYLKLKYPGKPQTVRQQRDSGYAFFQFKGTKYPDEYNEGDIKGSVPFPLYTM